VIKTEEAPETRNSDKGRREMAQSELHPPKPKAPSVALKCLHCSAKVDIRLGAVVCPNCKQSWPINEGVPRFFQPSYYWGEVKQEGAISILEDARQLGWREAATRSLKGDPNLLATVVGDQRVSWIPLLGLGADSVALDIGSGFGAITHALSSLVGQVYSLEVIPERVEFTRLRLSQERILNVHQIQATALDPPFCDETFDLIVVNGVLEWVGEFDHNGSAREVQLRFLRKLGRLLKKSGVLVIGIENRFGSNMLRGGIDHSGVSYTSLMPRKVASLYMRYVNRKKYRSTLPVGREYRTLTYSELGFRKLLKEAGIPKSSFSWSDPGYNEPWSLIPLRAFLVRDHLLSQLTEPDAAWKHGWRNWAMRRLASGSLLRIVASDFFIFASGSANAATVCHRLLGELESSLPQFHFPSKADCTLSVNQKKSVIRVFDTESESLQFVIKTSRLTGDEKLLRSELRNLQLVSSRLTSCINSNFHVPKPMGFVRIGSYAYSIEEAAKGEQFSRLIFSASKRKRLLRLKRDLPLCVEVAIQIGEIMHGNLEIDEVDPSWWQVPDQKRLPVGREACRSYQRDWVQHGDFTIENIFLDPTTEKLTVIDWLDLKRGLPPLYDVFSLLVSALSGAVTEGNGIGESSRGWEAYFLEAFFGNRSAANFFRELLVLTCSRLQVPTTELWELFLQFLVVRTNYFISRESGQRELYSKFLELAVLNRKRFIFSGTSEYGSEIE
jgi:SAM-dependent methyltransferase